MLQAPREEKECAIDCLDCLLQFYAAATTTCSSWLCVNPPHGAYAYFCSANVLAVHFYCLCQITVFRTVSHTRTVADQM